MNLETKYNLNQVVWPISNQSMETTTYCRVCKDSKKVLIEGEEFVCPNCFNNRHRRFVHRWFVGEPSEIGKVTCETLAPECAGYDAQTRVVSYMLKRTGVGSGTIWYEEFLFPSATESLIACAWRNNNTDEQLKAEERALVSL